MRLGEVTSTDLFVGSQLRPLQVVRVTLINDGPGMVTAEGGPDGPVRVRVDGNGVATPEPVAVRGLRPGETRVVDVPVAVDAAFGEGTARPVTVRTETAAGVSHRAAEITAAATGWTMFMVSHFHYDPVWWNTQRGFTQVWYDVPAAEERRPGYVRTALDLVRLHLDAARHDPDYKFVLAEIDYLKPHWDAHPEDRADLRRFIAEGRVELVGGMYNEPSTTLTVPESTIRNAVYGIGFQRDVVGGDPRSAWMLDVFGHDPSFPGMMADAGLTATAWARGPFHQNGPMGPPLRSDLMQFPMEFEWVSPSGRGLLTSYMAKHYGPGWELERHSTLAAALDESYAQFQTLKPMAATRAVLLPVGGDHTVPSRWCTEVHRDWASRYVWPRFLVATPREFFDAVRGDLTRGRGRLVPQSRDMNPVYTGKDVSYIDTKQAQRAAEVAVMDGERLATLATLHGARFPSEALDKAWRQLLFGAHHDGVTGVESDQVYLDLLAGWREAFELGHTVRTTALDHLATLIDFTAAGANRRDDTSTGGRPTSSPHPSPDPHDRAANAPTTNDPNTANDLTTNDPSTADGPGAAVGWPLLVANTLSWARDGVTTVTLELGSQDTTGLSLQDDTGRAVPVMTEGARRQADGTLAEITLTFVARAVPALGYRTYRAVPAAALPRGWTAANPNSTTATPSSDPTVTAPSTAADPTARAGDPQPTPAAAAATRPWSMAISQSAAVVENAAFRVEADPRRGGALTRILDKRHDKDLLHAGGAGNALVRYEEYSDHPRWREGPWHVLPKGPGRSSTSLPAEVRAETSPLGSRLVATWRMDDLRVTQETILWDGIDRIDFRTHVDGSIGQDRLLRSQFDLDIAGGLPVHEVGNAVIGRAFGYPDADTAVDPWTLDNAAHTWFGLGSTARIARFDDSPEQRGADADANFGPAHDSDMDRNTVRDTDAGTDRNAATDRPPTVPAASRERMHAAIGVAEVIAPSGTAEILPGPVVRDLIAKLAAQGVTASTTRPDGPRYGGLDTDSNLPDVRIVLGGPDDNAFAAQVLEAADPAYADWLTRQLAAGGRGRVWVPAAAAREQKWVPSADVRGARDLPVLIVDGDDLAAAVTALAADLADASVEVTQPAVLDGHTTALENYSAALLHRGTPGCVVAADGRLSLSLMRSCSGWPAGTWLDGPRRTAPDGSSFAWQHWSHSFEYALVADAGDWREAGFVRAGQLFNHTVLTRAVANAPERTPHQARPQDQTSPPDQQAGQAGQQGPRAGTPLPPVASLLEVEPASVVLTALKPRGNPLASGRRGEVDVRDGITARVYESTGQPAQVTLRLREGFAAAATTNLLEEQLGVLEPQHEAGIQEPQHEAGARQPEASQQETRADADDPGRGVGGIGAHAHDSRIACDTAITVQDLAVTFPVRPAETLTVVAMPALQLGQPASAAALGPVTEAAQPVFSRYWMHDKGAAPMGNVPVGVYVHPVRLELPSAGAADETSVETTTVGDAATTAAHEPATEATTATGAITSGPTARGALRVTVAASAEAAVGRVEVVAPPELVVAAAGGPAFDAGGFAFDLEPGAYLAADVAVRARAGAPCGRYYVAARIADHHGQTIEDVCEVTVGGDATSADTAAAEAHDDSGQPEAAAPLGVALESRGIRLRPGGRGAIGVGITNRARSEVRGEAQLISPFGTWRAVAAWTAGFAVAPGGLTRLTFPVEMPVAARPGSHAWALVKVMAFGQVLYTETVPVEVSA